MGETLIMTRLGLEPHTEDSTMVEADGCEVFAISAAHWLGPAATTVEAGSKVKITSRRNAFLKLNLDSSKGCK